MDFEFACYLEWYRNISEEERRAVKDLVNPQPHVAPTTGFSERYSDSGEHTGPDFEWHFLDAQRRLLVQRSLSPETSVSPTGTNTSGFSHLRIPQGTYISKNVYPADWAQHQTIQFCTYYGGGILLADALRGCLSQMVGANDTTPLDRGSISLRFEWPGYKSWSFQIKVQNWKKPPSPIKMSKLVTEIAKATVKFAEDMQRRKPTDHRWKVGPGYIEAHSLELFALDRVSQASWQPQFRLRT